MPMLELFMGFGVRTYEMEHLYPTEHLTLYNRLLIYERLRIYVIPWVIPHLLGPGRRRPINFPLYHCVADRSGKAHALKWGPTSTGAKLAAPNG